MKTNQNLVSTVLLISLFSSVTISSAQKMSVISHDKSRGLNGSFEYVKNSLPVNWQVYSPKTVPSSDFDFLIDATDTKEGKKSLKFIVRKCEAIGGWKSPGIAYQMNANSGEKYRISFWIKNTESNFFINVAGVSSFKNKTETIIKSDDKIENWKRFEYIYTIPKGMNALRFEANILSKGIFSIDDVKIEKI